jgi:hypothetical protein
MTANCLAIKLIDLVCFLPAFSLLSSLRDEAYIDLRNGVKEETKVPGEGGPGQSLLSITRFKP